MNVLKTFILLALCFMLSSYAHVPSPQQMTYSLAALKSGDRVVMHYDSRGCFHHDVYVFTITSTPHMTVKIEQKSPVFQERAGKIVQRTVLPRTMSIRAKEIRGLDRQMEFYRSMDKRDGCSTVDKITVVWYSKGQHQRTEHFIDGGCRTDNVKAFSIRDLRNPIQSGLVLTR